MDIRVGGLFTDHQSNKSNRIISLPYYQDDFTWCVQKAPKLPWIFSLMNALTPTVWLLLIFGYGYGAGFLLYLMIQFDKQYEQRNNRDWHYMTWLVSLPAVLGTSQRFCPQSAIIRFIYAFFLIAMIIFVQYAFVNLYTFIQVRFPKHQIKTIEEIVYNELILMGPEQIRTMLQVDQKVK